MRSPIQLVKDSWQLLASNFLLIFKFWLTSMGISLLAMPMLALIFFPKLSWLLIFLIIPEIILIVVLGIWLGAAGLEFNKSIILKAPLGVKDALKVGWENKGKYLSTTFWSSLAVLGGMLLFFIPGLIIGVYLYFTLSVFAFEKKSGTTAMGRSRDLVKGRFWKTVGYLLFPMVVPVVISIIISVVINILHLPKDVSKSLSQVLEALVGIPFLFYPYLLYQDYVANPVSKQ